MTQLGRTTLARVKVRRAQLTAATVLSQHNATKHKTPQAFIAEHDFAAVERQVQARYAARTGDARWALGVAPEIEALAAKARLAGLVRRARRCAVCAADCPMALCVGAAQWNLWAPKDLKGTLGIGLTNVDYAFMAELMGAYVMGAEVFNWHVAALQRTVGPPLC